MRDSLKAIEILLGIIAGLSVVIAAFVALCILTHGLFLFSIPIVFAFLVIRTCIRDEREERESTAMWHAEAARRRGK